MEPRPQSTNYCCGVYMRAAFIRPKDDIRAAFIRGRRLYQEIRYGHICIYSTQFHGLTYKICIYSTQFHGLTYKIICTVHNSMDLTRTYVGTVRNAGSATQFQVWSSTPHLELHIWSSPWNSISTHGIGMLGAPFQILPSISNSKTLWNGIGAHIP